MFENVFKSPPQTYINNVLDRLGKSDQELIDLLSTLAIVASDGHFTIMKFTTNWRVGLWTAESPEDIDRLTPGATLREAIGRLLIQILGPS